MRQFSLSTALSIVRLAPGASMGSSPISCITHDDGIVSAGITRKASQGGITGKVELLTIDVVSFGLGQSRDMRVDYAKRVLFLAKLRC